MSLLEAWLALRRITFAAIVKASGTGEGSIYNLIKSPDNIRASTADAITAAIAQLGRPALTREQVLALARARIRNPDRVSDEIAEALA